MVCVACVACVACVVCVACVAWRACVMERRVIYKEVMNVHTFVSLTFLRVGRGMCWWMWLRGRRCVVACAQDLKTRMRTRR